MKMAKIPFGTTDWDNVPPTEHAGVTGTAIWRTRQFGVLAGIGDRLLGGVDVGDMGLFHVQLELECLFQK